MNYKPSDFHIPKQHRPPKDFINSHRLANIKSQSYEFISGMNGALPRIINNLPEPIRYGAISPDGDIRNKSIKALTNYIAPQVEYALTNSPAYNNENDNAFSGIKPTRESEIFTKDGDSSFAPSFDM